MRSVIGVLLLGASLACAQATGNEKTSWEALQFLLGKWAATGGGAPGAARGEATFERELGNHIIVRRSYAEYEKGSAAGSRHDDLLILYADAGGGPARGIYFDSEGHVIHYRLAAQAPNMVALESDGSQPGPKFRLSYRLEGETLAGKFEIAETGNSGYKTYLVWNARRVREPAGR